MGDGGHRWTYKVVQTNWLVKGVVRTNALVHGGRWRSRWSLRSLSLAGVSALIIRKTPMSRSRSVSIAAVPPCAFISRAYRLGPPVLRRVASLGILTDRTR